MWNNKEIKAHARMCLRKKYLMLVVLTFLLVFIGNINTANVSSLVFSSPTNVGTGVIESGVQEAIADQGRQDTGEERGILQYLDNVRDNPKTAAAIAQRTLDSFNGTGGFLYSIMYQVDRFIFQHSAVARFLSLAIIILYLPFYIFVWNAIYLGYERTLIESQTYKNTRFKRVFSIFFMKGYLNACLVLLVRTLFLCLLVLCAVVPITLVILYSSQGFTFGSYLDTVFLFAALVAFIIFGCTAIKQYFALLLVPFILATNPCTKRKQAFSLSCNMMKGNIIHYVGLVCSFVGWHILSLVTLGVFRTFFTAPYFNLTRACMYIKLREHALEVNYQYSECINDPYLTRPSEEALGAVQIDDIIKDAYGMMLYPLEYPHMQAYRLNKIAKFTEDFEPKRHYSIINLILIFFIFSIIGWGWEVMLHIVRDGELVNRGTLHGPWLPIYGVGGVLIILMLKRFADKPLVLFPAAMILCGALEFFTSWILEEIRGVRWWDYSNYFLNIDGRICLEGLLTFAIGGVLFVYFFGPVLDNFLKKIKKNIKVILICVLAVLFVADIVFSALYPNVGKGITDYDQPRKVKVFHSKSN